MIVFLIILFFIFLFFGGSNLRSDRDFLGIILIVLAFLFLIGAINVR